MFYISFYFCSKDFKQKSLVSVSVVSVILGFSMRGLSNMYISFQFSKLKDISVDQKVVVSNGLYVKNLYLCEKKMNKLVIVFKQELLFLLEDSLFLFPSAFSSATTLPVGHRLLATYLVNPSSWSFQTMKESSRSLESTLTTFSR